MYTWGANCTWIFDCAGGRGLAPLMLPPLFKGAPYYYQSYEVNIITGIFIGEE